MVSSPEVYCLGDDLSHLPLVWDWEELMWVGLSLQVLVLGQESPEGAYIFLWRYNNVASGSYACIVLPVLYYLLVDAL